VIFYAETSALGKLILDESHAGAMRRWWQQNYRLTATCILSRTELVRAIRRFDPSSIEAARDVLAMIRILNLGQAAFDHAAELKPSTLRSLDAIHLAAALRLQPDLEGLVTYDARLADAATQAGVTVIAPT